MDRTEVATRRSQAAAEFEKHELTDHGSQIATSLSDGLTLLQKLIFTRIHDDVQMNIGSDSMMLSISPIKGEQLAGLEVDLFQLAISTLYVHDRKLVHDPEWYCDWLGRLRLGDSYTSNPSYRGRVQAYIDLTKDERRQEFSRAIEKVVPNATRAPLVIYRLIPYAVDIVTAVAFGKQLDAAEARNRQSSWLPAIEDCYECHGRPLDNGERCRSCGNPIWTWKWLQAPD